MQHCIGLKIKAVIASLSKNIFASFNEIDVKVSPLSKTTQGTWAKKKLTGVTQNF
jgi:hypothetical protein